MESWVNFGALTGYGTAVALMEGRSDYHCDITSFLFNMGTTPLQLWVLFFFNTGAVTLQYGYYLSSMWVLFTSYFSRSLPFLWFSRWSLLWQLTSLLFVTSVYNRQPNLCKCVSSRNLHQNSEFLRIAFELLALHSSFLGSVRIDHWVNSQRIWNFFWLRYHSIA